MAAIYAAIDLFGGVSGGDGVALRPPWRIGYGFYPGDHLEQN